MRTAGMRSGIVLITAIMGLGLVACEKKGPLEKAGEEADEAVHTIKNGGKETVADKVDDAVDKASTKVKKAVE